MFLHPSVCGAQMQGALNEDLQVKEQQLYRIHLNRKLQLSLTAQGGIQKPRHCRMFCGSYRHCHMIELNETLQRDPLKSPWVEGCNYRSH